MKLKFAIVSMVIGLLMQVISPGISMAQNEPPPPPPEARDGRGPGGPREGGPPPPSPEERLVSQLQLMLGCGDEEWAVLGPKIIAVQKLINERERFTKPRPPHPPPPPRGDGRGPQEDNRSSIVDLKADPRKNAQPNTLNGRLLQLYTDLAIRTSNADASNNQLQTLLTQFREARAQSDAQLAKARAELRELVTTRQEVILVLTGILE